jgi:hypothetical protein
MDQEKEAEILDRIGKLEARLSVLEEKVWRLSQDTSADFSRPESESDEPIIDG